MVLFDENIVIDVYKSLPFKVNGIGSYYSRGGKQVVATYADGEYTDISITDGINGGYVRTQGEAIITPTERLTCDNFYYKATQRLILVVGVIGYEIENVKTKCIALTQSIPDVRLISFSADKQQILQDEQIIANQLEFFKVVFDYSYDYITDMNGCVVSLCGSSGNVNISNCIEFTGIQDLGWNNPSTLIDNPF